MDWTTCPWVEVTPDRYPGVPVLCGTRMPAASVIQDFEDGMSILEIAGEYGLDEAAVKGALQFAGLLNRADAA